ncbi:chloride channel protein [Pedobacter sp. AW31-3R]|uniref:chloride channel protein n=1 Tax=Pedobacter sp. AW31-3R TaxID=3445781 RepID=UPI003F9FFE9A
MKFSTSLSGIDYKSVLKAIILVIPVAISIGTVIAFFLWALHAVIHLRFQYKWLLYLLPVAGIVIHFIYQSVGKSSLKGNNLIIEEIHKEGSGVPAAMAPVILLTTMITHLFGGSAGREGTAVQIGGSMAALFGKWFRLNQNETKMILTAGIAAGFGAVFGTPFTGAIFAVEVLSLEKLKMNVLLPALMASVVADFTVSAWQVHHTVYRIDELAKVPYFLSDYLSVDLLLLSKVLAASVIFGLASCLFSIGMEAIKAFFGKMVAVPWLIPALGGGLIICLTFILQKPDYLSLGVDAEYPGAVTIPSAFLQDGARTWSWLWKMMYTAITLATGFKGGEVTPLFYMGVTLGHTLSQVLDAPVSLFAAIGFIAVFSGATNTPLACTVMGMELFGVEYTLFFAAGCFTAYLFNGNSGIYSAQRSAVSALFHTQSYFQQKLSRYTVKRRK